MKYRGHILHSCGRAYRVHDILFINNLEKSDQILLILNINVLHLFYLMWKKGIEKISELLKQLLNTTHPPPPPPTLHTLNENSSKYFPNIPTKISFASDCTYQISTILVPRHCFSRVFLGHPSPLMQTNTFHCCCVCS